MRVRVRVRVRCRAVCEAMLTLFGRGAGFWVSVPGPQQHCTHHGVGMEEFWNGYNKKTTGIEKGKRKSPAVMYDEFESFQVCKWFQFFI